MIRHKKIIVLFSLILLSTPFICFAKAKLDPSCTLNGKKLYGKVKVVKNFADFKVKIVKNFAQLKVKPVAHFPDSCGKWQFVKNFPDFTIQYVKNFPDLEIEMVKNFPGLK